MRWPLLLLLVVVLNAVLCGCWMHRNGFFVRPIPQEHTVCRAQAIVMVKAFEEGALPFARAILGYAYHHGPVLPLSGALVGIIGGDPAVSPLSTWIVSCVVFGTLLILATYQLARSVGLTPGLAVAAAALTATAPIAGCYERVFFHQGPMAAFVTLALAAIVRSDGFSRIGPSAAAGLFAGLGTLSKNIAPVYLIGPVLAALVLGRGSAPLRSRVKGLAAAAVIGAVIVGPWLVANGRTVLEYVEWGTRSDAAGVASWDPGRWTYHWAACVNDGWGLIPSAVLLTLAVGAIAWRGRGRIGGSPLAVPVAQILASYPVLALWRRCDQSQYLLSWMPVLAVAAVELARRVAVRSPSIGRVAAIMLVAGGVANAVLLQRGIYDDQPGRDWFGIMLPPRFDWYLGPRVTPFGVLASPRAEIWPVDDFTEEILRRTPGNSARVLTTHQLLSAYHFRCAALLRGRDLFAHTLPGVYLEDIARGIASADYLVHDDLKIYPSLDEVRAWLAGLGMKVEVVLRRPVMEGRSVSLLKVVR